MPRSAAAARRSHPHSSSNRHENGLAVAGKRITRQKSNGYLTANSSSAGSSTSGSQVDLRASSEQQVIVAVTTAKANEAVDGSKINGATRSAMGGDSNGDVDVVDGHLSGTAVHNDAISGDIPPRADKATCTAKRAAQGSTINPLLLASTILKSCPLYDTVAILIFLLQLPPMVLTLVQFLFASLTFMPPGGPSSGSLSSNFDIFQGPAGTPSLGTMIAIDSFCLLVWGLFMWTWAQNFALDLAHVQVAVTLGGGGAGKNGAVNAVCVGIVLVLHLIRSKGIQDFVISHLLSARIVSPDAIARWSRILPLGFHHVEPQGSPSWIRSLLAIHILAQAGTAVARRSMAKNRSPQPARLGKRVDTEASAGSQSQLDSPFESGASVTSVVGAECQAVNPPVWKECRDRVTSAKKRRRQANQVRSRQPFWAALASTKVTVMREYEHSRAISRTTRGVPMTEDDLQGITLDDGLIWITSVESSSIKFAAADFASFDDLTSSAGCEDGRLGSGDMQPFYVCVNGAHWATAAIYRVRDELKGSSGVAWCGEIFGLAPNCAYTCSFVRSDTDGEICSVSVKTPLAPDTDQGKESRLNRRFLNLTATLQWPTQCQPLHGHYTGHRLQRLPLGIQSSIPRRN
jgi:ubiquitination network signaling protein AcrB